MKPRLAALALAVLAMVGIAGARAPLPPAPTRWVLDQPGLLSAATRAAIDAELEAFEAKQGSQVLLAIFDRLPEGEALEDWTQRVAEGWRVGRAKQDDGVVFFVFVADRQLRIEVGYGLEGALTDVESHRILDETVVPMLRAGDRDGAFRAGMAAIRQAIEGEYAPTPKERSTGGNDPGAMAFIFVIFAILLLIALSRARSGSGWRGGGPMVGGGGWGGGGFGGGGWSGGGGGFSGGGGSFGGGGASGRW